MSASVPVALPRGTVMLLGVVAPHDDPWADELLTDMLARISTLPDAPLMWRNITPDCLVAPPERGGAHLELYWIIV